MQWLFARQSSDAPALGGDPGNGAFPHARGVPPREPIDKRSQPAYKRTAHLTTDQDQADEEP